MFLQVRYCRQLFNRRLSTKKLMNLNKLSTIFFRNLLLLKNLKFLRTIIILFSKTKCNSLENRKYLQAI